MNNTQQFIPSLIVEKNPVLDNPNTNESSAGTKLFHKITKVMNKKLVYYTCDDCNTAYRSFKQVQEFHPNFDIKNLVIFVRPQRRII